MKLQYVGIMIVTAPLLACAGPNATQSDVAVPFAQVEARYPRMSKVHIVKCDRNGDQLFSRIELNCVSGIYRAIYLSD